MNKLIICLLVPFLLSCVSLRSISLTQIPKNRKKRVYSKVHKYIFMGISFNNDYVDEITRDLRSKCKGGKVTGILTKDEITSYILVSKSTVSASGYCVKT